MAASHLSTSASIFNKSIIEAREKVDFLGRLQHIIFFFSMNNDIAVQAWVDTLVSSLQGLWLQLVNFLPTLIGAVFIFVVAWIVAVVFGKLVIRLLQAVQADRVFDQLGVMKYLHEAGITWEFSGFVGWVVKWFFVIAGFLAAVDILGLSELSDYISEILLYIPNIVVAALILLVAAVLAGFLERVVTASMRATEMGPSRLVGVVVRWSIWGFAILAALFQLRIAPELIEVLFTGLVAMMAIAGGIAFGLGGQGVARDMLESVKRDITGNDS